MALVIPSSIAILKNAAPVIQLLSSRAVLGLLQNIDAKLDESLIRDALVGYRHLRGAATATNETVRQNELTMARNRFAPLCELDPTTKMTRKWRWIFRRQEVSPVPLILAGYYGSFCYFALMNDHLDALRYVYECTIRFPVEATTVFGKEYYSKDYAALLSEERSRFEELTEQLTSLEALRDATLANAIRVIPGGAGGGKPTFIMSGERVLTYAHKQGAFDEQKHKALGIEINKSESCLLTLKEEMTRECEEKLNALPHGIDTVTVGLRQLRLALGLPVLRADELIQ